ncbi:putative membrane protein [Prunus yedoensis var. nudiflora]|uniref:Putative membrane protein n=1 Tax=Prunus yedoensis var. nudiflora TaxID=2094558 RepID=A0A314UP34_PRUYE|nr:putative membrane protein [Prunus yedoensis var. nudiflora]
MEKREDNGDVKVVGGVGSNSKFPLSFWEVAVASTVLLGFVVGLLVVYLTMPASDYSFLKLPRSLQELQILRVHLEDYTSDYTAQVLFGYCMVYIFMQTFMIPGRPIVFSLWPDKLQFFQNQVAKRRDGLLNYMLFLRLTPTLPNTFINLASPIVDVPYHIFFLATIIGLIPAAYVTVRAGLALGELRSLGDLYDFNSIATLFFIGVVSVTPTLVSKSKS